MTILPPRRDYTTLTGPANALMPMSGIEALSPMAKSVLVRTGMALGGVEVDELGSTYSITMVRDSIGEDFADVDCAAAIENLLPHIERLARRGMTVAQTAARLGIPLGLLKEAAIFLPSRIGVALTGGLARGADDVTGALADKAVAGDPRAQKLWLEARGGEEWNPKPTQAPVSISLGRETALVSLDSIDTLQDTQLSILSDIDYAELSR